MLEDVQTIQCFVFILAGLETREPNSVSKLFFFLVYFSVKEACLDRSHMCMSICFPLTTHLRSALRSGAKHSLLVPGPVKGPVVFARTVTRMLCVVWQVAIPASNCGSDRGNNNTPVLTQRVLTAPRFFFFSSVVFYASVNFSRMILPCLWDQKSYSVWFWLSWSFWF